MPRILAATLALLTGLIALAGLPGVALAQKRVALVIGNSAYQHTPRLTNPKNDATDMAAALKKHGFVVVEGFDLDKAAFDRKVRDFANALTGAEVGLFFYAGHGLQVSGRNYLVPTDAELSTAAALEFEMVRVDVVHRVMEQQTNTNILFLDACRDNPLARNLARVMGTRSADIGRGLSSIQSGVGTLISFSTQPDNVALDGSGRNSPFAGALVKHMASASDDLSAILIAVRNDVMKETQRKQVPWEHSALTGRFYFNAAARTTEPAKVAPARLSEAAEAWGAAERSTNISVLEAFIARYKETFYAEMARARIDELKKQQVSATKSEAEKKSKRPGLVEETIGLVLPLEKSEPPKRADNALRPGSVFRDCPECPEMVVVAAGEFMMGSPASEESRQTNEEPQHKVTIDKPFAVGKFEVTFAEWAACVAGGGCAGNKDPDDKGWGRGKRPVIYVSWDHATQYVGWLSLKTGKTYRLLTEAEWEYAARGMTKASAPHMPFSTGATISTDQANYDGTSTYGKGNKGANRGQTVEVGSFPSNAFGLHDMHGNVWEWVQDCYKDSYTNAPTNGSAVTSADCSVRVLRGGSWYGGPHELRSALRFSIQPVDRSQNTGFRVARTL